MAAQVPGSKQTVTLFVTVGTTKFDALVHAVHSKAALSALLHGFGVTHIVCQVGKGSLPAGTPELPDSGSIVYTLHDIEFETFRLRPNISECLESADIVMSHAG